MDPVTPYYEREGVSIHIGDCREILSTLGTESHDLLVTDPPYGVGWRSNTRATAFRRIVGDDDAEWVPAALAQAGLCVRRNRHGYIFGDFPLEEFPLRDRARLVWDKALMGSGDLTSPWGPAHEPIMFVVRAADRAAANMAAGATPARLRKGSIIRVRRPNANGVRRHPTEKPVALLRRLIESSSHAGERVLDPFVGCGSTLVAAVAEGRVGTGVEIDPEYAKLAAERVDAALDAAAVFARAVQ